MVGRKKASRAELRRRFREEPMPAVVRRFGARFYVTIRDRGRVGYLLGPYVSHMTALQNVTRGRELARVARPGQTAFASFGTASRPDTVRTVFGR